MLVIATIVDKEGFEWLEQEACGILDARRGITLLANNSTQLQEYQVGADDFLTAQQAALEFADQ